MIKELSRNDHRIIQVLSWNYQGIIEELSRNGHEIIKAWSWTYQGSIKELSWNYQGIVMEWSWNYQRIIKDRPLLGSSRCCKHNINTMCSVNHCSGKLNPNEHIKNTAYFVYVFCIYYYEKLRTDARGTSNSRSHL